jgi:hypothetical protein
VGTGQRLAGFGDAAAQRRRAGAAVLRLEAGRAARDRQPSVMPLAAGPRGRRCGDRRHRLELDDVADLDALAEERRCGRRARALGFVLVKRLRPRESR